LNLTPQVLRIRQVNMRVHGAGKPDASATTTVVLWLAAAWSG